MSTARLDFLKTQLKHPLPTIRYNAVRSLGEVDAPEAIEYLRDVMEHDSSEGVRSAATQILAELGYVQVAVL